MPKKKKSKKKAPIQSQGEQQLSPVSMGDAVKIHKKSRLVDEKRAGEGRKPGELDPLNVDVTGRQGHVIAPPYFNEKRGENMVPIRLATADGSVNPNGAILSVPMDRLSVKTGSARGSNRKYSAGWEKIWGKPKNGKSKKEKKKA
jgi:hypothetical protein